MTPLASAVAAGAAAVLLLGSVIAAAQWILRRIYGESTGDPPL